MPRLLRVLRYVFLFVLVATSTTAMTLYLYLHGSLPALEGNHIVPGLRGKIDIERDAQGIPTLSALQREDIAYGTGFLHAQERFFQMDLQRRQPAGELSALIGRPTLNEDRRLRPHRFRAVAQQVIARASEEQRRIFDAYARGVNQGLAELRQPPFEYLLLRTAPEPWLAEDSVLVLLSMFLQLQDSDGRRTQALDAMQRHLPDDWYQFMTHSDGEWEAPMLLSDTSRADIALPTTPLAQLLNDEPSVSAARVTEALPLGSNQWAVSGDLTSHGHGLLANDMHLPQSLPSIWYRANWRLPEHTRTVSGVTLPGTPAMVVGTNEHIAWGFTNSYGWYSDLIRLEIQEDRYRTPDGWEDFEQHTETITVRDGPDQQIEVRHTLWGPVVRQDENGQWLALQWTAHDPRAVDFNLIDMETSSTLEEALALSSAGIPSQNLMVAERDGRIGWTIMGALPERPTGTRQSILNSADTATEPYSYLSQDQLPMLVDTDRLWNGNHRVADLPGATGDGEFYLGARGQQIRDRLEEGNQFTAQDMLDIQLDDRGRFMDRWRDQVLAALQEHPDQDRMAELIDRINDERPLHAHPDSFAYALARSYRQAMLDRTLGPVFDHLRQQVPAFQSRRVTRTIEYPLWAVVANAPEHLLNPAFSSWQALREDALSTALATLQQSDRLLTWGDMNTVRLQHPLSGAVPFAARFLDMPEQGMPGDMDMPRVQTPTFGASQRMVVAPGRESEGVFHMPGSQSGHPISPYYRRGHSDWAEGVASPLLPGETRYHMTLIPQR